MESTEPKKRWWRSVRSVIALIMALGFVVGFHRGLIDAGLYTDTFKIIVIFYFVKKSLESK